MFVPKVSFTEIELLEEAELIYQFLFNKKLGWQKDILTFHPGLEKVYSLRNKSDRVRFIKKYLVDFKKKEGGKIEKQRKLYRREWGRVEKKAFGALSELIGLNWPKSKKRIKAMLSINPICPRFPDEWSFSIFYKLDVKKAKEVILHESCHFLYFEKWKKVFPKHWKRTFEVPSIEWHLSEIITPILLNDPKLQKILKKKVEFYKEHEKIKIDGLSMPQFFSNLYKEYCSKERSFTDFIQRAYSEIKKRRSLSIENKKTYN